LRKELFRRDTGVLQKIRAREREELVGGLAENLIARGRKKKPAVREGRVAVGAGSTAGD
jgi:hypothetical protein